MAISPASTSKQSGESSSGNQSENQRDSAVSDSYVYKEALRCSAAVCQIVVRSDEKTKEVAGTAFLIGHRLLMTNHHVLPSKEIVERSYAVFEYDPEGRKVPFEVNLTRLLVASPSSGDDPVTDKCLDYAIVELEDHPSLKKISSAAFSILDTVKSQPACTAVIVHHPLRTRQPSQFLGGREITKGKVTTVKDLEVHYSADTVPGSSGGPIIASVETTNRVFKRKLSALHRAKCDQHYNCRIGVPINAIADDLRARGLADQIKASHKLIAPKTLSETLRGHHASRNMISLGLGGLLGERALPVEEIYTRLAIIEGGERKEKNTEIKDSVRDARLPTYETLFVPKKAIELETLFDHKALKGKPQQRVVVFGAAGIGKSTFCQKLATMWADPEVRFLNDRFRFVFWISLRDLNPESFPKKNYSAEDLLKIGCKLDPQHFPLSLEDREQSLLLLDGYDEMPAIVSNGHLASAFKELLKLFPHFLITSRPQTVLEGRSLDLEILGFDQKSIDKYIERFFNSEKQAVKAKMLSTYLKKFPLVYSLVHIPINLQIFCTLFNQDPEAFQTKDLHTRSSVYNEMINWLYKRFMEHTAEGGLSTSNLVDTAEPRLNILKYAQALEQIAWCAMERDQLYLPQLQIERVLASSGLNLEKIRKLGLLRIEDKMGYFIHLTFQEFFAAAHLANLYLDGKESKARKLVALHKFDPRFSLVFSMAAGYLSLRDEEVLQAFFDDLLAEPYDLAMSYELSLIARCFEECKDPAIVKQWKGFVEISAAYIKAMPFSVEPAINLLRGNATLFHQDLITDTINEIFGSVEILNLYHSKTFSSYEALKLYSSIIQEMILPGQILPTKIEAFLIDILRDPKADSVSQMNVAKTLEGMARVGRELPKKAVQALLDLLRGRFKSSSTVESAADALVEIAKAGGELSKEAVQALTDLLPDPKASCLSLTSYPIGALTKVAKTDGEASREAVQALVDFLRDCKASYLEGSAVDALGKVAKAGGELSREALQTLIALLRDPKAGSGSRGRAANALKYVVRAGRGIPKEAVQALEDLLHDPEVECDIRWHVAGTLGEMAKAGEEFAKKAVQALLGLLRDPKAESNIPWYAAIALAGVLVGELSKEALQALIDLLRDSKADSYTRRSTAKALGGVAENGGELSKEALQALIDLLRDSKADIYTRRSTAAVLGKVAEAGGEFAKEVLQALADFSHDSKADRYVQMDAINALGEVARANRSSELSKEAVQALVDLLCDPKVSYNRGSAAINLEKIAMADGELSKEAVQALIALLRGFGARAYWNAINALGEVARANRNSGLSKEAVQALVELLRDPKADDVCRMYAANALAVAEAGVGISVEAVEALAALLRDSKADSYTRGSAADALGEMVRRADRDSEFSKKAVKALVDVLSDSKAGDVFRDRITRTLGHINSRYLAALINKYPSNYILVIHICLLTNRAVECSSLEKQFFIADRNGKYPAKRMVDVSFGSVKEIVGLDPFSWRT